MTHVPTNTFGFYLVWNPNGRVPTKRHAEYSTAKREAERLAESNPNQSFYVMRAVDVTRAVARPTVTTEDCRYQAKDEAVQKLWATW